MHICAVLERNEICNVKKSPIKYAFFTSDDYSAINILLMNPVSSDPIILLFLL